MLSSIRQHSGGVDDEDDLVSHFAIIDTELSIDEIRFSVPSEYGEANVVNHIIQLYWRRRKSVVPNLTQLAILCPWLVPYIKEELRDNHPRILRRFQRDYPVALATYQKIQLLT